MLIMQMQGSFSNLVRRLLAVGLTRQEVCDRAQVHTTTFFRWEKTGGKPHASTYNAVERVIQEEEKARLEELIKRYPVDALTILSRHRQSASVQAAE